MAKPNYQFEKRQKELAKKNKKEEKRRQKMADTASTGAELVGHGEAVTLDVSIANPMQLAADAPSVDVGRE